MPALPARLRVPYERMTASFLDLQRRHAIVRTERQGGAGRHAGGDRINCRARASSVSSVDFSAERADSRTASPVPLTTNGAPTTTATRLNGFGICEESQLRVVQ